MKERSIHQITYERLHPPVKRRDVLFISWKPRPHLATFEELERRRLEKLHKGDKSFKPLPR